MLYTKIINMLIYIYTCSCRIHTDAMNNRRAKILYKKYVPLTLFVMFACERELETEQNCNILTPTLMAVSVVSFSLSRAAQPEAQRPTLLGDLLHLISNFSGPQLIRAQIAPSTRRGFPYHILSSNSLSNCNCLTSVLTELYNSSTPTQSPTRSLESHV